MQILLSGLFFACGTAAGQKSSPKDPCPYSLAHYEEDWSCVHNRSHSADSGDVIKDIALGEDNRVSAEFT